MPLITSGFHHVAIVANDVARTTAFYSDLLGFTTLEKISAHDDAEPYHLFFGDETGTPGTLLTVLDKPNAKRGRWGVGGIHHIALGVESEEAQLKWKRRLTDHGLAVSGPYDRGWFKSIYFVDPDGQILEIATNGPGYDLDEPIDQLGETVAMPKPWQMRGQRDEAAIAARTHPEPVPRVTGDMLLDGIHHVTGMTNDVELIGDFYERALGLTLVKRTVNQDDPRTPHLFWARYDRTLVAKHSSLTMFGWPTSNYYSRAGAGQTDHVAFRATNEDELILWQEHLRTLDIEVSDVIDRAYFKSIYFRAPDGLQMEIATDGPGFDLKT